MAIFKKPKDQGPSGGPEQGPLSVGPTQEATLTSPDHDADLDVELSLPPVELYVPSDEEGVDATPGWHGVSTNFNPETGRMETTVEKDGVQKVVPTEELDALQLEIYRASTAPQRELGDQGLRASGIEEPQKRAHITVIHDAQGPEHQ